MVSVLVFIYLFYSCGLVTLITFAQAICLLVWVWEGRLICTNAPSRLRVASKSAPVNIQMTSPHLPFRFILALVPLTVAPTRLCLSTHRLRTEEEEGDRERGRERESPGCYLMRSRSARVLFPVSKQTGAPLCRWGESVGFSLVFLLFLGSCDCHLHLNNHHFTETVSALTRRFFLSGHILPPPIPNSRCIKTVCLWRLFLQMLLHNKSPNYFIKCKLCSECSLCAIAAAVI